MDQAGRGDIVDLAGDTASVVMNQVLGLSLEYFTGSIGQGHAAIDIGAGLFSGKRMQGKAQGNAVDQVGVRGTFEDIPEAFLAAQDDFERYLFIDGGDQQAQVGQGLGINQMGLIDDQQGAFFVLFDALEDLQQHAVLSHPGSFAEFGDNKPEKGVGLDGCEMKVKGMIPVVWQLMDEEPQ